jgi:hypothetical protein
MHHNLYYFSRYRTVSFSAGHAHYVYTCSQDIEKEKQTKASAEKQKEKNNLAMNSKTRDRRTMDHGNCTGVLRFFISNDDSKIRVAIRHIHCHAPYEDIQLPAAWKEFIENNLTMSPGKVLYHVIPCIFC